MVESGTSIASSIQPLKSLSVERFGTADHLPSRYPRSLARDGQGRIWVAFMAEQGVGEWVGIAMRDASGTIRAWRAGAASGLRSDHATQLRFFPAVGVVAATDHGLHRFVDDGRFDPIGPDIPVSHVTRTTDEAVWAVSETDSGFRSEVLRFVFSEKSDEQPKPRRLKVPKTVYRPMGIFPVNRDVVSVVYQNGLLDCNTKGCRLVPLRQSPLWKKAVRDPDGNVPEIWIHAADAGSDGTMFFIGHTRRLVARHPDGRWETVAEGHFSNLVAGGKPGEVFVADFQGRLFHAVDGRFEQIYASAGSHLGNLFRDSRNRLWMTEAPNRAPEKLLRFSPPYSGGPEAFLSLGNDQGLLSPGILAQLDDGAGGLWLSTNEGLWHVW